jgi:hypothetical protein
MTSENANTPSEHVTGDPGHAPAPGHGPSEQITADPGHAHGHGPAAEQAHFSDQEWQEFRDSDKTAGAYIVVLMQGIFVVGLVLYLIVLWSVV